MRSALRTVALLLLVLSVLAACTAPPPTTLAPTATSTPTARQRVIEAAPSDRVVLASGHYQLLMLYSPLWTSCRELAPVVNGLMKKYTDRAAFVRVNIHDPRTFDLQTQLGFDATPEFYLVDPQGRIERKWDDSIDLAELEKTIRAISPASWKPAVASIV